MSGQAVEGWDPELVAVSRSIDLVVLGERLKTLRLAAGMTQGQVGGDDVSVAHVSRIESGKRRADLGLLSTLAGRVGATLDQLLLGVSKDRRSELRLNLDYAELALRSGNAADALEKSAAVVDAAAEVTDAGLAQDAAMIHALALEALGHLNDAIIELEQIVDGSEASAQWTRAAIALTRCYRESGDFVRATDTGERALARLESVGLDATDEGIRLAATLASVYDERGDISHAIRICRKAATKAEEIGSAQGKAAAYWNASIFESELGHVEAAIPLARHALTLLEAGDDNRNLAKLHSQLGMFLLATDPPDPVGAQESLQRAGVQLEWSAATAIERGYNTIALARAKLMLGALAESETLLATLADVAEVAPLLGADCALLRGQLAGVRGEVESARAAYLDAVHIRSGVGADRAAAQMWVDLGTLLDELGETAAANTAFRNAATSTGLAIPRGSVLGSAAR